MPRYRIPGFGKKTGRKRNKVYEADSLEQAMKLAYADETIVDVAAIEEVPPDPHEGYDDSPTQAQLDLAQKLGLQVPPSTTRGDLSKILSIVLENPPATYKQKRFARRLGIEGYEEMSRAKLSDKIDEYLQTHDPPKRGLLVKLYDFICDQFH